MGLLMMTFILYFYKFFYFLIYNPFKGKGKNYVLEIFQLETNNININVQENFSWKNKQKYV